jgi:hypothetical protein
MKMSGIDLLVSDAMGVYIPQIFARFDFTNWTGIDQEDIEILLRGPDHPESENYWDAWSMVVINAVHTDPYGNRWRLHQDGDLWIYCEALMTAEEHYNFFGDHPCHPDLDSNIGFETDNWYDTSMELH